MTVPQTGSVGGTNERIGERGDSVPACAAGGEPTMSSYEQAEQVRDMIAGQLLDGVGVLSVGIKNDGADYCVAVTATHPVKLPALPSDLQDVVIDVVLAPGPARHHGAVGNQPKERP